MSRDPRFFLEDIITSCEKIMRYTHGLTLSQFATDEKTFDAVVRNLTIIGEAVKRLPQDLLERPAFIEENLRQGSLLCCGFSRIDSRAKTRPTGKCSAVPVQVLTRYTDSRNLPIESVYLQKMIQSDRTNFDHRRFRL